MNTNDTPDTPDTPTPNDPNDPDNRPPYTAAFQSDQTTPPPTDAAPGQYDVMCEMLTHVLHAKCVMLVVIGGVRGHGFSLSTTNPGVPKHLPEILRNLASMIEAGTLHRVDANTPPSTTVTE